MDRKVIRMCKSIGLIAFMLYALLCLASKSGDFDIAKLIIAIVGAASYSIKCNIEVATNREYKSSWVAIIICMVGIVTNVKTLN